MRASSEASVQACLRIAKRLVTTIATPLVGQRDVAIGAVALRAGEHRAVAQVGDPAGVGDDLVVRAC